ncbi:MAG TPA: hypothetical protein PL131_13010 [Methylotenera sp.]|nr:hypothetical protein [Methylotenera sp.]
MSYCFTDYIYSSLLNALTSQLPKKKGGKGGETGSSDAWQEIP